MHFLRPDLIDKQQGAAWQNAMAKYERHFREIARNLPPSALELSRISFHDLSVEEVLKTDDARLMLTVGWYKLQFREVLATDATDALIGRAWLYSEFDLYDVRHFELRTVFDGGTTLRVVAGSVTCIDTVRGTVVVGSPEGGSLPGSKSGKKNRSRRKR